MMASFLKENGLWLVLSTAFALRVLYLFQAVDTPLFEVLLIDSEFYDSRAREIGAGNWLGDRVFFMNPFYSYFLAVLYAISGTDYFHVALVQSAMGVCSCALVYGLGSRLWGQAVGLLAAGLAAVYGPYLFYDGALLTASPITLLNLGALYCLLRSLEEDGPWLWAAGLLLGLSATARPLVLLFVFVLGGWYLNRCGRAGLYSWGKVLLGCGLVVGLVVLRNFVVGGELLLTTSSAGMNLYVGNHPGANGIYSQVEFLSSAEPDLERLAFVREAERISGESLSPGQVSRFWLEEAVRFAFAHPLEYLRLLSRKLYMFCNSVEAQNNVSIYFARDFVPLLRWNLLGWGILFPLALANWIQQRRSGNSFIDLYLAAYLTGCMLFFVSSEYRLPVVPILCLYSARWILFMQNSLVQKNYTAAVKSLLLVALLAIPVNYQDAGARQLTLRRVDYYNFATLYQRRGNWLRAEEFFRQALRIDPNFIPAQSGLDGVLARQREAGGEASVVVDPGVRRGLGLFKDGDYEAAILVFKRAIKRNGPQCQIYNNIGLSYYRLGGWEDAINYFKLALGIDSLYVRAHYNLGLVHRRKGDEQAAQHDFAKVLELDTDNDKARFQLAVLFAQMGRKMEAETHWELLLARNPGDQRLRGKIDSIRAAD